MKLRYKPNKTSNTNAISPPSHLRVNSVFAPHQAVLWMDRRLCKVECDTM